MASRTLALAALLPLLAGCFGAFGGISPSDYLSGKTYTRWVIEVDYAQGHRPTQELLNFMKGRLEGVADKPDGIEFHLDDALPVESRSWGSDVVGYARSHQDEHTGGKTVVTHLLFLAGGSDQDEGDRRVLGAAYGRSPIVIFDEALKESCSKSLPLTCSTAPYYRSVLAHEFGHAMGLVNNGIGMVRPHEASDCEGQPDRHHSTNAASVMNCRVETSFIIQVQTPPDDYDADDRADLRAAGGK